MTDTTEAIEDVAVVDAPPIPGLSFRRAHDDDWPLLTEILNLGRVADGVDEVLSAEGLSSEYRRLDTFETTRDLLIAQIDGDPIGFSLGHRNVRGSVLVLDLWGSVVPEQRRRGIGTALHRTARARLAAEAAADPHPGPRRFQSFALDIERSDIALLEAEGFVPIRSGFEMRRELAGALPHAPFPEGVEL
ncbi:MAG TPA: GNAT family N-acetyltransferase, partial [Candidatus Limnocylindrales bacterium]